MKNTRQCGNLSLSFKKIIYAIFLVDELCYKEIISKGVSRRLNRRLNILSCQTCVGTATCKMFKIRQELKLCLFNDPANNFEKVNGLTTLYGFYTYNLFLETISSSFTSKTVEIVRSSSTSYDILNIMKLRCFSFVKPDR